jgi:SAM-dependent methyltransferase
MSSYMLSGQASELERLQLQSRVWEPSGCRLLDEIGEGRRAHVVDVGCGAMGWLRLLSEWVGPDGKVVGTDIDDTMLEVAGKFVAEEDLGNVTLVKDDLFASELEPSSFDLVHARYQISPLGRGDEQMRSYLRLARPDGLIVLEDPDISSWHFNPPAPACEELIRVEGEVFARFGDANGGRTHRELLGRFGIRGDVRAEVLALEPGHPYLRLPLQFAAAMKGPLLQLIDAGKLEELRSEAERELQEPGRWGTTFTLIQAWGRRDHEAPRPERTAAAK